MATEKSLNERMRALPKVDEVVGLVELGDAIRACIPETAITDAVRASIQAMRERLLRGEDVDITPHAAAREAECRVRALARPSLRAVVNATGVILHTNIGRSPLAQEALDAVVDVSRGYSTLEYSVENMARGSRHDHIESLVCALTGAEAAMAVNNNAAATLMVLSEFAKGHEAVVSRGELVEIGGSFRIPEIMATSGAKMVEVGATNKTHVFGYERAITSDTAMLLKVHTSNYRIVGFPESVTARDLAGVARVENARRAAADARDRVMVYEDLGSGSLLPPIFNAPDAEPTVGQSLSGGCDLVSFSGDKLLGGPQAGIIVGKKAYIDRLKKNPLARAMRLDKMTLAALEATLRLYLDGTAYERIPTLRMLNATLGEMREAADALAAVIEERLPSGCASVSVVEEFEKAGGGSLPHPRYIPAPPCASITCAATANDCERAMGNRAGATGAGTHQTRRHPVRRAMPAARRRANHRRRACGIFQNTGLGHSSNAPRRSERGACVSTYASVAGRGARAQTVLSSHERPTGAFGSCGTAPGPLPATDAEPFTIRKKASMSAHEYNEPSIVIGTAGHIDHGKSTLVQALTGTDPDRLVEEKRRGITIELGFARLDLPGGASVGIVDVPGHEKFVRQMIAGATGIDAAILVVAARRSASCPKRANTSPCCACSRCRKSS